MLELRSDVKKAEARDGKNRIEKWAFRAFAWLMTHPRLFEFAGRMGAGLAPPSEGNWIRSFPVSVGPLKAWLSERDLPPPPAKSFREMWRQR